MALIIEANPLQLILSSQYFIYLFIIFFRSIIHELVPQSHAYITGLAMVLGYTTFGIEGVLIGPILIVMTVTFYEIFQEFV